MSDLNDLNAGLTDQNTRYGAWSKEIDQQRDSILEQKYGTSDYLDLRTRYGGSAPYEEAQREALARVGEGVLDGVDTFLNELCDFYSAATKEQRRAMRDSLGNNRKILYYIYGYIGRVERQLKATRDHSWLRKGLAAASLENARVDYRDLSMALGELAKTAAEAGIDPFPYFQEAAALSSEGREDTTTHSSLRAFLSDFLQSAYFRSITSMQKSTAPRRKKKSGSSH
jgi:hypothetical protein